jgi:hypothetical protein
MVPLITVAEPPPFWKNFLPAPIHPAGWSIFLACYFSSGKELPLF